MYFLGRQVKLYAILFFPPEGAGASAIQLLNRVLIRNRGLCPAEGWKHFGFRAPQGRACTWDDLQDSQGQPKCTCGVAGTATRAKATQGFSREISGVFADRSKKSEHISEQDEAHPSRPSTATEPRQGRPQQANQAGCAKGVCCAFLFSPPPGGGWC
jgi:hypothetical protein